MWFGAIWGTWRVRIVSHFYQLDLLSFAITCPKIPFIHKIIIPGLSSYDGKTFKLWLSTPSSLFQKVAFCDLQLQNSSHKKNSGAKNKKREGEDTSWHITRHKKNFKGEDTSWRFTRRADALNGTFSTLNFATVRLCIHVEFLNDERGKEKDRWCCRLYYWLNPSYYW